MTHWENAVLPTRTPALGINVLSSRRAPKYGVFSSTTISRLSPIWRRYSVTASEILIVSGPRNFYDAVRRRSYHEVGKDVGDVVGHDRLHQSRREVNLVALSAGLSNAEHKLEKLRRLNERVRDVGFLDKSFLSQLSPKVPAGLETLGADDG